MNNDRRSTPAGMNAFAQQLGGSYSSGTSPLGGHDASVSFPLNDRWTG